MIAARDGTLWVTTLQSVVFLRKGATRFQRAGVTPAGHASLSEDPAGRIWLSDLKGSRPLADAVPGGGRTGRIAYPTPAFPRATRTFFDRDGQSLGQYRPRRDLPCEIAAGDRRPPRSRRPRPRSSTSRPATGC